MAFFKRELGPIERFENALKEKQTARQKLAERLSVAESELAEKRAAAEKLAVAGAANARLDRAEASMRAVEDRTKAMRAELLDFDEQVASAATPSPTRSRRWLRRSSGPRRHLMVAPPRSLRPSPKPRCRYRKPPGSRATWTPCAARFSRRRT